MREGEHADSVFIVRSGRVEVVDEGPPEALIRVLRRGDVLGELALLREGARSASVRARRDTELLELGRARLRGADPSAPSFALGLTRAMGAQLAASRTPVAAPPRRDDRRRRPRSALLRSPRSPTGWPRARGARLGRSPRTRRSRHDRPGRARRRPRRARGGDRSRTTAGRDLCLREADLVVAVSERHARPSWLRRARPRCAAAS